MKTIFQKIFKTISMLFLLAFILFVLYIIIVSADHYDVCLDSGYCKEGLALNINGKAILINEQTCIKNNGKWFSIKKVCQF